MKAKVLITGGAGFIGCNLADRLLTEHREVTIFDNLSRRGCLANLAWLRSRHGDDSFRLVMASVTDAATVAQACRDVDRIYHLAGQVAVTTSIVDPRRDFEDNALGTINVLEGARQSGRDPILLYASTNKVYGSLEDLAPVAAQRRYTLPDHPLGIDERHPLDFHSPYGCSKGCGDQYVRDWARIYGMRTVVLRQSCIYGPRQLGLEDQGWVAHLALSALRGETVTIYGDGKQVRDLLHIDDLLAAYELATEHISAVAGEVFNIGGGPERSLAVWAEFGPLLEELVGRPVAVRFAPARAGDQRCFVSDIRKARRELGWQPQIGLRDGLADLVAWARANHDKL